MFFQIKSFSTLSCPEDWIDSDFGCFHFAKKEAGALDYFQAQEHCVKKGGGLAEIKDKRTQLFLAIEAKKKNRGNYHWWIGAQILPNYQKVSIHFLKMNVIPLVNKHYGNGFSLRG